MAVLNGVATDVPPPQQFQQDQYFTGGAFWSDPAMGAGIWSTLRYAPAFSYDIPIPNGFYTVKLDMLEPNKTAAGQRVFTITANGIQSDPIDLFKITGAINAQTSITQLVMVGNGHLRIAFQATAGNAVVTALEITPSVIFAGVQTVYLKTYTCSPPLSDTNCVLSDGTPAPTVPPPAALQWFTCIASQNCAGLEVMRLKLADGSVALRVAVPLNRWINWDPKQWAAIAIPR